MWGQEGKITKHVINESPGCNPVVCWLLNLEDVIQGLMGDERFAGDFHYKYEMDFNDGSDRLFCEPHTCEAFRIHAQRCGPGVVPISIVLYIDGTSTMTNISLKPVYGTSCRIENPLPTFLVNYRPVIVTISCIYSLISLRFAVTLRNFWESEMTEGVARARCSPFNLKPFHGENVQVNTTIVSCRVHNKY